MATVALVAARGGGYGDFIVGLLIGVAVGFLLGPAVRSWLAWREWTEASRQARLTDEVLTRMEDHLAPPHPTGPERPPSPSIDDSQPSPPRPSEGPTPPRRWRQPR